MPWYNPLTWFKKETQEPQESPKPEKEFKRPVVLDDRGLPNEDDAYAFAITEALRTGGFVLMNRTEDGQIEISTNEGERKISEDEIPKNGG